MGTKITWPNIRLSQAGIGNPLFVTDIENATENQLEALAMIYGFASNGFAILSGFNFDGSQYSGGGIVYMNGNFYKLPSDIIFDEGFWLGPNIQDVDNKIFGDANTYATYRIYEAEVLESQWGGMPEFTGNMNQYRISIKKLWDTWKTFGNIITHNTSEFDAAGAAAAAQAAAASDATTKANAAQSAAISTAAADATTKANAAVVTANGYTDSAIPAYLSDYGGFILANDGSAITNFSGVVSYKVFGKLCFMNIVATFDITSSSAFIALVSGVGDQSAFDAIVSGSFAPVHHIGLILYSGAVYKPGLLQLNNNPNFGVKIRSNDGTNFAIGTGYYINFSFVYYLA